MPGRRPRRTPQPADRLGAERVAAEDHHVARGVAGRRQRRAHRPRERVGRRAGDLGHVAEARQAVLQRGQLRAPVHDVAALDDDHRRRQQPRGEAVAGGAISPHRLAARRQPADQAVARLQPGQARSAAQQQHQARQRGGPRVRDGQADRAAPARGLGLRLGILDIGARRGHRLADAPRPEQPVPRDGHRRGHERHRHGQPHQHRHRHARAERLQEPQLRGDQRRSRRRHGQRGGDHRRGHLRARRRRRDLWSQPIAQPSPVARYVEDRVVSEDPEQQHDDDRLHLAGHRDAERLAHAADHPQGDEIGQRDRRRPSSGGPGARKYRPRAASTITTVASRPAGACRR